MVDVPMEMKMIDVMVAMCRRNDEPSTDETLIATTTKGARETLVTVRIHRR